VNQLLIGEVIILKWKFQNTVMYIKGQNFRNSSRTINSLLDRIHPIVCIYSFGGLLFLTATVFSYALVHRKMPPKIYFIYSCNKEIYYTFKTCCIIYVLFSTKHHWFQNVIPFCSNTMFFKNYVLKLNTHPGIIKVSKSILWLIQTNFSLHLISVLCTVLHGKGQ